MDPARLDQLADLFDSLRRQPAAERATALAALPADLRGELEDLLAEHDAGDDLLAAGDGAAAFLDLARSDEQLASPAPTALQVPGFRIRSVLGGGAQGAVYEAEQLNPRRTVALKVLLPQRADERFRRRFEREADALARLHHPGIAVIHGSGSVATEFGELPWFAMELVRGRPLAEHAAREGLDVPARLDLLARVCDAVAHAHAQGIVHRDLKPANILVDEQGAPRVLDFGVARVLDPEVQAATLQTETGQVLGTLQYMSPEQAGGLKDTVDARTDVFALGVIAFQLLTGRLPRPLDDLPFPEALREVAEGDTLMLGSVDRSLRGDLQTLVAKATAREPARRYADAGALAADLRRYLNHEPLEARAPSLVYAGRRYVRRHPVRCVALALLLVGGLVLTLLEAARAERVERERYRTALAETTAALAEGRFTQAHQTLAAAPPARRGWEWHVLQQTALPSAPTLAPDVHEIGWAGLDPTDGALVVVSCTGEVLAGPPAGPLVLEHEVEGLPLAVDVSHGLLLHGHAEHVWLSGLRDGRLLTDLGPTSSMPRFMQCQLGGDALVALRFNRGLRLHELPAGALIRERPDVSRRVYHLAGDRSWMLVDADGELRQTRIDQALRHGPGIRGPAEGLLLDAAACSADETLVALAEGGELAVHERRDGRRLWTAPAHAGQVVQLGFAPDGSLLVSAGDDGLLRFWDPRTGRPLATVPTELTPAPAFSFGPEGATLVAFGRGTGHGLEQRRRAGRAPRPIQLWDLGLAREPAVLSDDGAYVYPVAWSPDDAWLASADGDGVVRLWDGTTGQLRWRRDLGSLCRALAFDPSSERLFAGNAQGLYTLDLMTGVLTQAPELDHINALAWDELGGGLLAAFSLSGSQAELLVLDPGTLAVRSRHPAGVRGVTGMALSPNGRRAVLTTHNGPAVLLDGPGWTTTSLPVPAHRASWSPDGRWLATAFEDTLRILDGEDLSPQAEWSAGGSAVLGLTVSPDGTRLVSGGRDGLVRLWDAATWEPLAGLAGHRDYVYGLAFSSDGQRLCSGSGDGDLRLWSSEPLSRQLQALRAEQQLAPQALAHVAEQLDAGVAPAALLSAAREQGPAFRRAVQAALLSGGGSNP